MKSLKFEGKRTLNARLLREGRKHVMNRIETVFKCNGNVWNPYEIGGIREGPIPNPSKIDFSPYWVFLRL